MGIPDGHNTDVPLNTIPLMENNQSIQKLYPLNYTINISIDTRTKVQPFVSKL